MASSRNKKVAKARARARARASQPKRRSSSARQRDRATEFRAGTAAVRGAGAAVRTSPTVRQQSNHVLRATRPSSWLARVTVGVILLALVASMFSMLVGSTYQW